VLVAIHDPLLVLASYLAVFALLVGARAVSERGAPPAAVRRSLHAAIGLWTAFAATLFLRLGWALAPPIGFLAANASGRTGILVPSLARPGDPGATRGLWTFPLGIAAVYWLFWNDPARAPVVAGCLALALADPAAAWAGTRWGQRRLRPLALRRTLEGSIVFFVVAALVVGAVAAGSGGAVHALRLAVGCGAVGALAEALAPPGWDNATIPVAVGAAYHYLA
jgi:dolichol kinase